MPGFFERGGGLVLGWGVWLPRFSSGEWGWGVRAGLLRLSWVLWVAAWALRVRMPGRSREVGPWGGGGESGADGHLDPVLTMVGGQWQSGRRRSRRS